MSDKIFAPSAERNKGPISDAMEEFLPDQGRVLEIASGTGQHVIHFAQRFSGITWQPTDQDPTRVASISEYALESGCKNILPPMCVDATQADEKWQNPIYDAVVIVNLIHLISETAARAILRNAATAIKPGGHLFLYGPFMRAGELTSQGDIEFHNQLQSQNPATGYKDDFDTIEWLQEEWLDLRLVLEMPANNLMIAAAKP